jgi:hypothetical protein
LPNIYALHSQDHIDHLRFIGKPRPRGWDTDVQRPESELSSWQQRKTLAIVEVRERPRGSWSDIRLQVSEILLLTPMHGARPHRARPSDERSRREAEVAHGINPDKRGRSPQAGATVDGKAAITGLHFYEKVNDDVDRWTTTVLERHENVLDTHISKTLRVVIQESTPLSFFLALWVVTLHHERHSMTQEVWTEECWSADWKPILVMRLCPRAR